MALVRRIELLETRLDAGAGAGGGGLAGREDRGGGGGSGGGDNFQPRIIKDKMTDQIKLEDTLIDYMEIIISMNAKLNNHIHGTKMSLRELDGKIGAGGGYGGIGGGASGLGGGKIDDGRLQQKFVEMDTEIEKLRLDIISSKQNEKMR